MLSVAGLPLPPFESTTKLLVFFIALTLVSHGAVLAYVTYLSPTLATDDGGTIGAGWKFDPATVEDSPDDG